MPEVLTIIVKLSIFTFIITSLLTMGLYLTVEQIVNLPSNVRVMLLANEGD